MISQKWTWRVTSENTKCIFSLASPAFQTKQNCLAGTSCVSNPKPCGSIAPWAAHRHAGHVCTRHPLHSVAVSDGGTRNDALVKTLFIYLLILKAESQRQGDTEVFHPLVHSPASPNSQGWDSSGQVLHVCLLHERRGPLGQSATAFPGALGGGWIRSRAAGLELAPIQDAGVGGSGLTHCTTGMALLLKAKLQAAFLTDTLCKLCRWI